MFLWSFCNDVLYFYPAHYPPKLWAKRHCAWRLNLYKLYLSIPLTFLLVFSYLGDWKIGDCCTFSSHATAKFTQAHFLKFIIDGANLLCRRKTPRLFFTETSGRGWRQSKFRISRYLGHNTKMYIAKILLLISKY